MAVAPWTLVVLVFCIWMLLAYWRTVLKFVAVTVIILAVIGTRDVVAAVTGAVSGV